MRPILIRADAGGHTGTGHLMRMIALAQAHQDLGGKVAIASACPKPLIKKLARHGVELIPLKLNHPGNQDDAKKTIQLAKTLKAEWIFIDNYYFNYNYQKQIKVSGKQLLCVDDYGHTERWHCDAILNQNLDAELHANYQNDTQNAHYFLGSPFSLLRKEFSHATVRKNWKKINRLLITLGGSDTNNITEAVLRMLNNTIRQQLRIRVICGSDNPHRKQLGTIESAHQIEIKADVLNMQNEYDWADGVISAGGSTCWEWLHAGLPGATVTIADNQKPIVKALCIDRNAALNLGTPDELESKSTHLKLMKWIESPDSCACFDTATNLIDGQGAKRIIRALH